MAAEYQVRRIIKPVMDFVKLCPFADEFHIDLSKMSTQKFIDTKPDCSSLDFVGSVEINEKKDAIGNKWVQRQANFQVWLLRSSAHEVERDEIGNFLFNFEQWVEYCQYYNTAPKIGDLPNEEKIKAENGIYFSEWDGKQSSVYLIQMNIVYVNQYKMIIK